MMNTDSAANLVLAFVVGAVLTLVFFGLLAHSQGVARGYQEGYKSCLTDFKILEANP